MSKYDYVKDELFIESRGLAIFKQFDPYVIRVVCNRK